MPLSPKSESALLSLQRASEILGVHPATLRVWSDQGKIKAIRTAGGHRRFSLRDVQALVAGGQDASSIQRRRAEDLRPSARVELPHEKENALVLVQSALGRARMEVADGGLSAQAWYLRFDEAAREQHRGMGRRLLALMLHYLNAAAEPVQAERTLSEARNLGSEYGRAALSAGLTLGDAMRAFLYFRDSLLESVVQLRSIAGSPEMDSLTSFRLVNTFTNEILVAMVATFQES
jgi:excisionase family DNA binding protein